MVVKDRRVAKMHTPSDGDWIWEARKREVYQASEARWSVEGVTIVSPQNSGRWLDKLKNLLSRLKPSETMSESILVSPSSEVSVQSKRSV